MVGGGKRDHILLRKTRPFSELFGETEPGESYLQPFGPVLLPKVYRHVLKHYF